MIRNCNRPRYIRGFTLLEVLVALAIVALALSAALASMSQQLQAATAIQERSYANWVAQNKLTAIRLSSAAPEVSEDDDEARFADLDWNLTTTISETGVENLFRVDVDVYLRGRDDRIRRVTGFVGEPGIPGQANQAWIRGSQSAGDTE